MKVLLASFDSPATLRGGVEWYVHHLARHLLDESVEVQVLSRAPRGDAGKVVDEVPYAWVGLPSPKGSVTHRYRLLMQPFYDRAVARAASGFDLVHGQNLDAAGALGRKPVVATVHTTELDEWPSSRLGGWREALYQRRIHEARLGQWRRMAQGALHLVSPAEHVADSLRTLGAPADRVEVFPNPIEPLPRLPHAEARAKLGLDEAPHVLYLGRLARVKRVDRLVRALQELPDARLLIAGDGPEAPAIAALVESEGLAPRVRLLGRVDDAQKALLLNAADVLVLPSEHEGQPLSLLEAISVGLPVVATHAAWVPEGLRQHGAWGDDLPKLIRGTLGQGRHAGGAVPDYRALARRMADIYRQALGR